MFFCVVQHSRDSSVVSHCTYRLEKMCSRIDTLTHVQRLPWTVSLPTLLLIAQVVFLSEVGRTNRQTNSQTQLIVLPTPRRYHRRGKLAWHRHAIYNPLCATVILHTV